MKNTLSVNRSYYCNLLAISLLSILSVGAKASIDETAIMSIVDKSVKEYRVYATCLSLDELSLSLVKESWNKSKNEALHDLKSDGANVLFLGKFALATDDSKIFDPSIKLSEAMSYCYKNKKQIQTFYELGNSHLEQEIFKLRKNK